MRLGSPERPLRVLVVAHNAVAASNRQRVDALAGQPQTEVTLLTPSWWFEEGGRIEVEVGPAERRVSTRPPATTATAAALGGSRPPAWHVGRSLFTGNSTRYVYLSRLFGLVRRLRPDVIDVHEEPFSFSTLQALLARELLAPRAALVCYSAVNVRRQWRPPYRWVERALLTRADAMYAPSQAVLPVLREKGYAGPAATIPLGIDADRFAAAEPLDLPGAPPRIGFLGRLEPVKGLDILIEALARLATPALLVLAGDGSRREALRRQVETDGLGGRVAFIGEVTYDRVPGYLKALDVLVLPSVTILPEHKEQFGRVLIEAMAAGVPVVGSSSGAIPEVIGDAGLVVPERDPTALANALDRLLGDGELRRALVERGRQRAGSHYAWPAIAARTRDLYMEAIAHRRVLVARRQEVAA